MSNATPVGAMDDGKKNSPVIVPSQEVTTVILDTAQDTCHWNDQAFSDGDHVCSGGTVYECSFGKWATTSQGC